MGIERGAPGSHKFVENPSAEEGSIQAAVVAVGYAPEPDAEGRLLKVSHALFAEVGEIRLTLS